MQGHKCNAPITSFCRSCDQPIFWNACPTGGWWDHIDEPADHHDPATTVEVNQYMDDNGYFVTDGLREPADP
ncbi:hypothetical protein [Nocardia carnea]|uniref:hypothetical protein n=1 Tax=Nocardia carnea TaxID=37328 RepID=UPI00245799FC|nr:hypothetical protein [Nocardia carnea]